MSGWKATREGSRTHRLEGREEGVNEQLKSNQRGEQDSHPGGQRGGCEWAAEKQPERGAGLTTWRAERRVWMSSWNATREGSRTHILEGREEGVNEQLKSNQRGEQDSPSGGQRGGCEWVWRRQETNITYKKLSECQHLNVSNVELYCHIPTDMGRPTRLSSLLLS